MKKALLLAGLLLALTASVAMAAGVSISWGKYCWGASGASSNLTWACNSNTYTGVTMSLSFQPGQTHTNFVGVGLFLEGMSEAATVPDWWLLDVSGTCRYNQLVTLDVNSANMSDLGDCSDLWLGGAGGGGIGLYSTDTNRMHLNAAWAVPDPLEDLGGTNPETVYWCGRFSIAAGKTKGCALASCQAPVIWGFQSAQLAYQAEAGLEILDTPYAGGNQCLTWQNSTLPCAKPVPARNTTWGQLKSLYR